MNILFVIMDSSQNIFVHADKRRGTSLDCPCKEKKL